MTDKLLAEWFWTDRWTGSSAFGLPMEARGLYREMLTQAWRRGARLPNNPETIRRFTGCTPEEWERCWPAVKPYWTEDGDWIYNETQRDVYATSTDVRDFRSKGGKARAAQAKRDKTGQFQPAGQLDGEVGGQPATSNPSPSPSPSPDTGSVSEVSESAVADSSPPRRRQAAPAGDVDAVLAHYREYHPRARPGEKERKAVRARLKDGYSVADLQAAIDGNHRSAFHCGDNDQGRKYHGLDLIFRSADKVRDFMEIPENGRAPKVANPRNIAAMQSWLEKDR